MIIKISYINYWIDKQNDSYFTEFIRENISKNIEVVKPEDNPDILFCSCNGKYNSNINYIKNLKSKIKVFYYGENLNRFPPFNNEQLLNETFDLIIGFNKTDIINKKLCFPLWLIYYKYYKYNENDNVLTYIENKYKQNKINKKTFCSLVCRHDRDGQRTKIINSISKYGNIQYGGIFKNNVGNIGGLVEDKINFISKSIFNICPENSIFEGYNTEKIFQAFEAGTIPLYLFSI